MQDTEYKVLIDACFIKISVMYVRDSTISNIMGSFSEHNTLFKLQHKIPKFVTLCEYPDEKKINTIKQVIKSLICIDNCEWAIFTYKFRFFQHTTKRLMKWSVEKYQYFSPLVTYYISRHLTVVVIISLWFDY